MESKTVFIVLFKSCASRICCSERTIFATTGIAIMALVFRSFTTVVLSHSSHVNKMVEVSEKQKEMEALSMGAPV